MSLLVSCDGKLLVSCDGKLLVKCPGNVEPPFTPGTECADCEAGATGRTPAQYSIAFSGIADFNCAFAGGALVTASGLAGSGTAAQDMFSPCEWDFNVYLGSGSEYSLFTFPPCSGSASPVSIYIRGTIYRSGGNFSVSAIIYASGGLAGDMTSTINFDNVASANCIATVVMNSTTTTYGSIVCTIAPI